jgi:uncharacterized OB-fold protein
MSNHYLPEGLQAPAPDSDQVAAPFWEGLRQGRLLVQRCMACRTWQFGPEFICYRCHSFDPAWVEVSPEGRIYSWERVWHPVHPALKDRGAYLAVLIELPHAGGVRLVGNLLGDVHQAVRIGDRVQGRFEDHANAAPHPYSLLHWQTMPG